jgi:hypothetical protein
MMHTVGYKVFLGNCAHLQCNDRKYAAQEAKAGVQYIPMSSLYLLTSVILSKRLIKGQISSSFIYNLMFEVFHTAPSNQDHPKHKFRFI